MERRERSGPRSSIVKCPLDLSRSSTGSESSESSQRIDTGQRASSVSSAAGRAEWVGRPTCGLGVLRPPFHPTDVNLFTFRGCGTPDGCATGGTSRLLPVRIRLEADEGRTCADLSPVQVQAVGRPEAAAHHAGSGSGDPGSVGTSPRRTDLGGPVARILPSPGLWLRAEEGGDRTQRRGPARRSERGCVAPRPGRRDRISGEDPAPEGRSRSRGFAALARSTSGAL